MSTLKLENIKHENSVTDNMVMDSDGSVSVTNKLGVGTTTPEQALHVKGGEGVSQNITTTGNQAHLRMISEANNSSWTITQESNANRLRFLHTDTSTSTNSFAMYMYNDGYVTTPSQPSFKVYDNSGTEYTGTTLLPNVVVHDTGSNFNTSNGRFTCPVDGVYLFRCDWRQTGAGAGYLDIRASDGQLVRHEEPNATIGNWFHQSMTAIFKLSANDYVWLQSGGSKGIRWDTNPVNHFAGVLIG